MEIKYSNSLFGKSRPCHPLNKFGQLPSLYCVGFFKCQCHIIQVYKWAESEWVLELLVFLELFDLLEFFIAWIANGSHDGRQWWWSWWLTIILIMMMVMMVLMVIIKPTVNDLQAEGGGHISCKIRVCDNFVWVPEMSVSVWWSLVSTIKSRNTEECNKSLEKATVDLPGTLHV